MVLSFQRVSFRYLYKHFSLIVGGLSFLSFAEMNKPTKKAEERKGKNVNKVKQKKLKRKTT